MIDAIEASGADIEAVVNGYLECQLWAGLDMGHPSCDCHQDDPENSCHNYSYDENYGVEDIAPEYVVAVREELTEVVASHPLAYRMYIRAIEGNHALPDEFFGHDFYLTREGHGAGFWDRGLGELGKYLTDIAKSYGSAETLWDNGDGLLRS